MNVLVALAVAAGVVGLATALGLVWRARTGRVRGIAPIDGDDLATIAASAAPLGAEATLLQFSVEVCTPCRSTARALGDLAGRRDGITHVELDLADLPGVAQRLNILQTPTVFVLDRDGRTRARIGGAPRMPELLALIESLTEERRARIA